MAKPNLMSIIDEKVDSKYVHEAINAALNTKDIIGDVYLREEIDSMMNLKSDSMHLHSNHYSIEQSNELLENKADVVHSHDDIYINKEDIASLDKSDLGGIGVGENENGTQMIFRGGTELEHSSFVGVPKEITVDTTNWTLRVHDGVTVGGHKLTNSSTYKENLKYIVEEMQYNKLLTKSDTQSYTKNEMNYILKTIVSDLMSIIGGA